MGPGEAAVAVFSLVSIASIFVLRGPLGRALADRLRGRAADAAPPATAELLERALGELEDVRQRLGELEERQDFTERVLARASPRSRLPAED